MESIKDVRLKESDACIVIHKDCSITAHLPDMDDDLEISPTNAIILTALSIKFASDSAGYVKELLDYMDDCDIMELAKGHGCIE